MPEYELYSDLPPGSTSGTGGSAWVTTGWFNERPSKADLAAIEKGQRVLLCGAWTSVNEPGANRVLRLGGLQVLSAPSR